MTAWGHADPADDARPADRSAAALVARRRPVGRLPLAALLLVVAVGLAFADASVVALALPDLYGELDTTIVGVSWVLTTYALVVAVVAIPVALLHRRIRPAVLAGTGLGLFAGGLAGRRAGAEPAVPADRPRRPGRRRHPAAGRLAPRARRRTGLAGPGPDVVGRRRRRRRRRRSGPRAACSPSSSAWRAIFLVQAPVAAVALLACVTPAARALVVDRQIASAAPAGRPRSPPFPPTSASCSSSPASSARSSSACCWPSRCGATRRSPAPSW